MPHTLESGNITTGAQFYETLAKVHASRAKALSEVVENAMSAEAREVTIDLLRGAELRTATAGNAGVLVVKSDTHIADVRQTVQFAHSRDASGHGILNNLGIGSKALMSTLGADVQMLVFTKDGPHAALARMGSVVDALAAAPGQIGRAVWSGTLDAAGNVDIDWAHGDNLPIVHALCTHSPWSHPDEHYRRTLQRMWSLFRAEERVTAFVYYAEGGELPMRVDDGGRLCVLEADGERDVVEALAQMYLRVDAREWGEPALPAVVVQGHAVAFGAFADADATPLHVPGLAEPLAWVSCARVDAERRLQPYVEKRSGALFTLGNHKVLNVGTPSAYFTGEVFGLTGTFDLNLAAFQRGDVRPAQYAEFVRFVACGVPDVAARVHAAVGLATFRAWTPRGREMWSRLGTDVLAHVRLNPSLVEVTPDKTQVRLRGCAASAMVPVLARLRLHVLRWGMAERDGAPFAPPFGAPEPGDDAPAEAPRGRGLAIVPYVAPPDDDACGPPPRKRPRRAAPRVAYARKYRDLLAELGEVFADFGQACAAARAPTPTMAAALRRAIQVYTAHKEALAS
jgi:hypothetical protein